LTVIVRKISAASGAPDKFLPSVSPLSSSKSPKLRRGVKISERREPVVTGISISFVSLEASLTPVAKFGSDSHRRRRLNFPQNSPGGTSRRSV
jgi:hypothetical protein